MKLSIVTAVLDSHEVVRRQILHYKKILSDDTELILVDDKSNPPLNVEDYDFDKLRIFRHEIQAKWTQPAARNYGVKQAVGEYVIVTDIDHILMPKLIDSVMNGGFDYIKFRREMAVLDENGEFVQTPEAVFEYGFEKERYKRRKFRVNPHTNSFGIKRELYLELGGVSERYVGTGRYPNREEVPIRRILKRLTKEGKIKVFDETTYGKDSRPIIYMIPNGRFCGDKNYNPFGLFHNLKRN